MTYIILGPVLKLQRILTGKKILNFPTINNTFFITYLHITTTSLSLRHLKSFPTLVFSEPSSVKLVRQTL